MPPSLTTPPDAGAAATLSILTTPCVPRSTTHRAAEATRSAHADLAMVANAR
jgi:hypothetical protein